MDRFFPGKKAVETVTLQDLAATVMFCRCADIFSGKRQEKCAELDSQSTQTNFQNMVRVVSHLSTRRLKSGLISEIGQCHRPSPERHCSMNIVVKQPIENFWEFFFG